MRYSKVAMHQAIAKFQQDRSHTKKKKTGRPRITTAREDHIMRRIVMRSPTSSMKRFLSSLYDFKLNCLDKRLNTNIRLTGRLLRSKLVLIFFIEQFELVGNLITTLLIMWSSRAVVIRGLPVFFFLVWERSCWNFAIAWCIATLLYLIWADICSLDKFLST